MTHLGFCRRKGCGEPLVDRMDNLGRLVVGCEMCAHNRAGFCRDCPGRLERPTAARCNACSLKRKRAIDNAHHRAKYRKNAQHREHELQRKRERRKDPVFAERERRRCRERYARIGPTPRDEMDRAYTREWNREARKDRAYCDRINARRREITAQRRAAGTAEQPRAS
jgi:hypothetical protein